MDGRNQDPLHGITLKTIVTELEAFYGFERLGKAITIKCFTDKPSVSSSLKFLRKTPWAREKVEQLYLKTNFDQPILDEPVTNDSIWANAKKCSSSDKDEH